MRLQLDEEDDVGIALAPLIDVVFLLLIFFLVGSVMEKPLRQVPVVVAQMKSAQIRAQDQTVPRVITIDRMGRFFIDGRSISRSELLAVLDVFAPQQSIIRLRLDVDQRASVKYLAEVLAMLRERGITNFGLRSEGYSRK